MDFDWSLFVASLPSLARGAEATALLTVSSLVFALLIGIVGALLHATAIRPLVWAVTFWTTFIRGLPVLVILLFFYYGLPSLGILLNSVTVAIAAFSITAGAFVTEIVRAGIESIDRGQMRAAKSLGMSWALGMRHIVLPQALRRVLPPLTNEAITLLKNTALVSVIAIPDLLRSGTDIMTWKANTFSPFAGVALFYLCMTLPLVALNAKLEKRYRGS
jgi:His/Glu/Gln/Arg/opine family amino acid ABC transporter permease subunit